MAKSEIQLSVVAVNQPIGEFFVASIAAEDLVKISFSDVRRLVRDQRDVEKYLGIQRPLSTKRVAEIRKYIQGSDATFPTAVIVAIDERCATYSKRTGILTLRPFVSEDGEEENIPSEKIAKVLDGQHRIAAFLDENDEYSYSDSKPFDINLAIFIGADISEQANIFATVNLAQTKVNRSLAYDLTELAKTRSPHRTCHNVAVALDEEKSSPFYHRIKRLGTATPGREREPITQAAFVESLVKFISIDPVADRNALLDRRKLKRASAVELEKVPFRNLFIDNRDTDIAEIIYNYFDAVRSRWPDSWDKLETPGNLLPRSNTFKALMVFLHQDVYPSIASHDVGRIPKAREFAPFFERVKLKDSDFTTRTFVPGSGGQAMFLKVLRNTVTPAELFHPR